MPSCITLNYTGGMEILLNELSQLNLPISEYVIIGSGPLAIRGIRSAKDLDILVSDTLWVELSAKFPTIKKGDYEFIRVSATIDVHGSKSFPEPRGVDPSQVENIKKAEIIDGFPFQCVEHFLYYKDKGTKEKEKLDAQLLRNYLAEKS